eukprot:scaffold20010_cov64-Phaeocystis_antarctica.AAC.1
MSADIGERGLLGGLVAREIAMRRAVVDVTTVVGAGDNSVAAGNGIIDTQHHWQPLQRASDAQLLNAPAVCDGNISECIGTSELGMKVIIQLCLGRLWRTAWLPPLRSRRATHCVRSPWPRRQAWHRPICSSVR